MSYSSIWFVRPDYFGEEGKYFDNSYRFSTLVWDILGEKYIPEKVITPEGKVMPLLSNWTGEWANLLNSKMNASDNIKDRVCWELTMQSAFFTKDKKFIAKCIRDFLEENKKYGISDETGVSYLCDSFFSDRFKEIADFIENIDEKKFPYFFFKNTSCDDGVERLFFEFDELSDEYVDRSLKDINEDIFDFVEIKNKDNNPEIHFISNLEFFK